MLYPKILHDTLVFTYSVFIPSFIACQQQKIPVFRHAQWELLIKIIKDLKTITTNIQQKSPRLYNSKLLCFPNRNMCFLPILKKT